LLKRKGRKEPWMARIKEGRKGKMDERSKMD
jgi:hypothetical protein